MGFPYAVFVLTKPYSERRSEVLANWLATGEAVHLWEFREYLLGVFLYDDPKEFQRVLRGIATTDVASDTYSLVCDTREASVPVYFDFEGAWCQVTKTEGPNGYPRTFPATPRAKSISSPGLSPRDRKIVSDLLSDESGFIRESGPARGAQRWIRQDPIRRLHRTGALDRRVFLDPGSASRWMSPFPPITTIIRGEFLSGSSPERLWSLLVGERQLFPFLYCSDGKEVLFACLARPESGPSSETRALGVDSSLKDYLQRIVVVREPLRSLRAPLSHRFERPLVARD